MWQGEDNAVADALSRCCFLTTDDIPEDARAILRTLHGGSAGHPSARIIRRLATPAQRETIDPYIDVFVRTCPACLKTRQIQARQTAWHSTQRVEPFETVQLDTIGPLPESTRGNRYIITIIDSFTKYVDLVPVRDTSADSAAQALLAFAGRFGIPQEIHTDGGSQYRNKLMEKLTSELTLKHHIATAYHPQSSGIVERANGTAVRVLRKLMMEAESNEWQRWLYMAQFLVNSAPHRTLGGISPLEALLGISPRHLKTPRSYTDPERASTALASHIEALGRIRALSKHAVEEYNAAKRRGDHFKTTHRWKPHEFAFIIPSRKPQKLSPFLRGPLKVLGRGEDPNVYRLKDLITKKVVHIHGERMIAAPVSPEAALKMAALDHDELVVEAILDHDLRKEPGLIKILWAGFERSEATWEPLDAENRQLVALDSYLLTLPPDERSKLEKRL
ncbi:Chromo (CHRromatin Organization MOdifier) domain [Carpediemonas membranifera]|uniref:Chromo (CHRromatin Organization MOdifier) domain n=2 Tax=Carpediemonas membranifera TaxID=201153 RepID=A0A8J6AVU8_9EUKA|nr:Chromo (CHRromatin Organization MOdifier) domain [Carpediemonas membranifera]|eukprot:KAG9395473.1 Chromo (CHRromatin Organization MOdifier) domain [Carpediemonas membranifera]